MSATALVELRAVSRWSGEVIGINRVTATLRPGVTGLLGPNGSGKSTLMNLVTGMLAPSQGEVLVHGEPVFANPRLMHEVGYCTQVDSFYETMTGVDFVASLLEVRGWARARARSGAIHALEQLGMRPNMDRKIRGYSKGMRQRTKVALAIAHNPSILVLDEPLNGLDALGRHEMMDLVRRFGREGRNVLISSHILHEVGAMTNNILVMAGGYVLAEGDVREVRAALATKPRRIELRCDEPRRAALHFLAGEATHSVEVDDVAGGVVVQTRRLDEFHDLLNKLVLELGIEVRTVSVTDESVSSIFDTLSATRRPGGTGQ